MSFILIFSIALAASLFSSIFIFWLRVWAEKKQLYDFPNERSSHRYPIPRGGGLAIVICTLLGVWLLYPIINIALSTVSLLSFTLTALLIAVVSWIDDVRSLPNRIRFTIHSLGAITIMIVFGYFNVLKIPFVGEFSLGWLGMILTFVWVVGLTNAYNFMDGIDGIAGSQAVIAGAGWFVLAVIFSDQLIGVISLLIVFSSLGFLLHNWPPAKIFMGDVGSAFLGFTFASIPLIIDQVTPYIPILGGLMVWPFIFDSLYTFLRRLRKGEDIFAAHRSHLYQRLVIAGMPHNRVTLLYIAYGVIGLFTSYFLVQARYSLAVIGVILIFISIVALLLTARRYERLSVKSATIIQ
jgi:UDP-N-acetylmuramyl pentapeptide phosphotransferase/UDP-N-acetylglucosamine-1-phosphate transferase